jgi:hypothetical protein
MKKEIFVLSILTAGLLALPSFAAHAGCCSDMGTMPACPALTGTATDPSPAVAAVLDNYTRIQTALAQDSLKNISNEAQAIAKAVNDDAAKTFSTNIANQAGALAKATDLPAARAAFKTLSLSLIAYVSKNPSLESSYRQVHCPMAAADWLQKGSVVNNPYLGKEMAHCGEFVKTGGGEHKDEGHSMPGMHM